MKTDTRILKKFAFPPFYFFASIVLIIVSYFVLANSNLDYFPLNLSGLLFFTFGAYLSIKYTVVFNREKTTLQNEKPSSFVKKDFYKHSRNPMYLGGLIFLLGLAIMLGNIFAFIVPILFFLVINFLCIPIEEKIMSDTFKEEYAEYKKKVKRWI